LGFELGPLEAQLMQILWSAGELQVREVAERVARPLAYTTVMTTLDRLFKKGFLLRRKVVRAFVYRCRWTPEEWRQKQTEKVFAKLLERPKLSTDHLVSCLVDAMSEQDASLLDELEQKLKLKKLELEARRKA